jgi:hypothetical protein
VSFAQDVALCLNRRLNYNVTGNNLCLNSGS